MLETGLALRSDSSIGGDGILLGLLIGTRSGAGSERLLEVGNDVVDVLSSHRDTDGIFGDTRCKTFLLVQLLVGRGPGVNGQCLGITDAESCVGTVSSCSGSRERMENVLGEIGDELEVIHDLTSGRGTTLDAK
jgi:hypothetical protein